MDETQSETSEVSKVKEVKKSGFGKVLVTILLVLVILFVLAGAAATVLLYLENSNLKKELKNTQDEIAAEAKRKEEESCLNACSDEDFLTFASEVWKKTDSYKFAIEADEEGVHESSHGEYENVVFYRKSTTDEYVQDVYGEDGMIYEIKEKNGNKEYKKDAVQTDGGREFNTLITWANDVIMAVNNEGVVAPDGSQRVYEVSTTKEELDGVKTRKVEIVSTFIHDAVTDEETWLFWVDIDGHLVKYGFESRQGEVSISFTEIDKEFGTEGTYSWIKEEVDANI